MFKLPVREEGQGLVEYALVLVLVAVVVIVILTVLGSSIALVYAQVIGGFTGQVLTKSGREYIVLSTDISVSGGGGFCDVDISKATIAVVQDGALLENSPSGDIQVSASSGGSAVMKGTTNNFGLVTVKGSLASVGCPSQLSIGNTGYRSNINPP